MPKGNERLRIERLSKQYGKCTALEDVSFSVEEGEFCILLGPSGCGKSTLLQIIAGINEPTQGSIFIENRQVDRLSPRQRDVAMVFQSYALYPHMTVAGNLAFPLKVSRAPKREIEERVNEAARLLSLEGLLERYPRELSGGQRQRVAIGRAIVRQPKLFLFDEPLSNLDARLRVKMRSELASLHKRLGATMVYVTHDQTEAMTLGEKVVILDKGRIQQIGTPSKVYHSPDNLFVATFIGSPEMNLVEGEVGAEKPAFFSGRGVSLTLTCPLLPGRLTVGMRPEDLSLSGGDGMTCLGEMTVFLIENLGPERLVYLKRESTKLVMRCKPALAVREGEKRMVYVKGEKLYFFRGGERIVPRVGC